MIFFDKVTAMYACHVVLKSFLLFRDHSFGYMMLGIFSEGVRDVVIFCYDRSFC